MDDAPHGEMEADSASALEPSSAPVERVADDAVFAAVNWDLLVLPLVAPSCLLVSGITDFYNPATRALWGFMFVIVLVTTALTITFMRRTWLRGGASAFNRTMPRSRAWRRRFLVRAFCLVALSAVLAAVALRAAVIAALAPCPGCWPGGPAALASTLAATLPLGFASLAAGRASVAAAVAIQALHADAAFRAARDRELDARDAALAAQFADAGLRGEAEAVLESVRRRRTANVGGDAAAASASAAGAPTGGASDDTVGERNRMGEGASSPRV